MAHGPTRMEKAVKPGETKQFFLSRLTKKKVTKICAEHQGLTATMREDARGFQYLFVIVI